MACIQTTLVKICILPNKFSALAAMKQQARAFAVAAHGAQRYGDHPYSHHLDAVAALVEPYGDEAGAVAYLHDTVEDTAATLAEIEQRFGPHVAACVALLTDEPGASRKERKAKTSAKLATAQASLELAMLVKVADRLANVRACVADRKLDLLHIYRSEQAAFRTAAYRPHLCEPLWAELDALLPKDAPHLRNDSPPPKRMGIPFQIHRA